MFYFHGCLVGFLLNIAVVQCSNDCTVSVLPPSLCGTTQVSAPMCSAISWLQYCTNLTLHRASCNSTAVITDAESYLTELATNCTPIQLVVLSSQITDVLAEQVMWSITDLARAIVQLTRQFGWRKITIVADISDTYFLRTAENVYKIANSTSDVTFLQLGSDNSEIEDTVRKIERLNLRIIVLSVRSSIVSKLLSGAQGRNLMWPQHAWIIHSVDVNANIFKTISLEGVISVRVIQANSILPYSNNELPAVNFMKTGPIQVNGLASCFLPLPVDALQAVIHQQIENRSVLIFSYDGSSGLMATVKINTSVPSDLPPQYTPTFFMGLYYTGIMVCFIVVTLTLVLYVCLRNERTVKASSVSLSILIFIGCYLILVYLFIINSTLWPTFHMQSVKFHNILCILISILHGLGYPIALILSTLLVKLLRVYRIFNFHGKLSKFTSSNFALAVYALLLSSPSALITITWIASDPYTGIVTFSIRDGFLHVSFLCISSYAIEWLIVLLIYIIIIAGLLITFAILTRKIKYKDFKDTKKVSVLSCLLMFTLASILSYWYLLRSINADVILILAVLQVGHYCIIFECMGFIFAPKLFPAIKEKLHK